MSTALNTRQANPKKGKLSENVPLGIVYPDALATVADERFIETPASALARQISTQQGQETGYKRGVTRKGTP